MKKIFTLTFFHRLFAIIAIALLLSVYLLDIDAQAKHFAKYTAFASIAVAVVLRVLEKQWQKNQK
ncbi:MAG: hypothetical protein PHD21_04845 [Flavobacteriales bacterium]|nr:hypothetical protein [Flavobacteriales bacterium]